MEGVGDELYPHGIVQQGRQGQAGITVHDADSWR